METHENKFSVLRDICLAVGIQINFRGNANDDKHYILENDSTIVKKYISEHLQQAKLDQ